MLELSGVVKRYKNSAFTLANVDLTINKGEFVFLTGNTGAGKSTLLNLIYAKELPDEGKIIFDGTDMTKAASGKIQMKRRKTGIIFQENGLIQDRTVFENTAYPLYIKNIDKKTLAKRVGIALRLTEIAKKQNTYPDELSGGEKQKACIARAVVNDPILIIADEPTSNIDKKTAYEIMQIFKKLNDNGITLIIATHEIILAKEFAGRIIELKDGRISKDEDRSQET